MSQDRRPAIEFIVLVALLNAMVAMSIDTMLPAIGLIASELGARHANDQQMIITLFFAGLTLGTLVTGPISDTTGRKPAILGSLALYAVGAVTCLAAWSFPMLLAGRFIQGFGAAGPRIVSIAMVRDGQQGAAMARVMSFVMSVFMLVPIMAPSVGQLVLLIGSWRVIFGGFLVMASIAAVWLALRQEETLTRDHRHEFSVANILQASRAVVTNRLTLGYTLATGSIFAGFIVYLGTSPDIFVVQYAQGKLFALWFGGFATGIALAMIVNGRLVMRFGMRTLSKWALRLLIAASVVFLLLALASAGHPPLWAMGICLFLIFFSSGMLFGNFNAMAMEPMGRIAGMAAAISGAISSLWSLVLGGIAGQFYVGAVTPLAAGFAGFGLLAWICTEAAERGRA
jgi:MFS transporter, DHA1 family, multidrug resistance protein